MFYQASDDEPDTAAAGLYHAGNAGGLVYHPSGGHNIPSKTLYQDFSDTKDDIVKLAVSGQVGLTVVKDHAAPEHAQAGVVEDYNVTGIVTGHNVPDLIVPGHAGPWEASVGHAGSGLAAAGQAGPGLAAVGHAGPRMAAAGHAGPGLAAVGQVGLGPTAFGPAFDFFFF